MTVIVRVGLISLRVASVVFCVIVVSLSCAPAQAKTIKPFVIPEIIHSFAGPSKGIIYSPKSGTLATIPLAIPDDASGPTGQYYDRQGLANAGAVKPPNSWLAKLDILLGADEGSCVATAVGDRVFVTAAHCVYDNENQRFYSGIKLLPKYAKGSTPFRFEATKIVIFNGFEEKDFAHDVAFVVVENDLPHSIKRLKLVNRACPPPYPVVELFDYRIVNGEYIEQMRHVGNFVWPAGCDYGMFWNNVDGPHGTSGSPLIESDAVVAVYSGKKIGRPGIGMYARLTRAKICFLREEIEGKTCN